MFIGGTGTRFIIIYLLFWTQRPGHRAQSIVPSVSSVWKIAIESIKNRNTHTANEAILWNCTDCVTQNRIIWTLFVYLFIFSISLRRYSLFNSLTMSASNKSTIQSPTRLFSITTNMNRLVCFQTLSHTHTRTHPALTNAFVLFARTMRVHACLQACIGVTMPQPHTHTSLPIAVSYE